MNKQLFALLAVLILLAFPAVSLAHGTLPSATLASVATIRTGAYAKTTAALNLRSGPSTSYSIKLVIPAGSQVLVNNGPYNAVWYDVTFGGTRGYVHGGYLAQTTAVSAFRTGAYATTTTAVNLRSGPSTAHAVQRVIPFGSQVFVNSGPHNGIWYDVTFAGTRGYVHGAYLVQGAVITVSKLNTSRKVVALTFDAGSDRGYAVQILNTLAAQGVKASFGITGQWAEANPDLVRRMAQEGHTIINHTYTHRSFTGRSTGRAPLSYAERVDELWRTHSAISRIAGVSSKPYFRPPYGDYDSSVLVDVKSRGYAYNIMWSVDSLGWNGLSKTQITQRVLNGLEPGAIYLFHVGSASQDGPALVDIIRELRARGYSFATIAEFYR